MLDTNILSYLMKKQQPYCDNIKNKILETEGGSICISVISLAEVSLGLEQSKDIKLSEFKKQELTNAINHILKSIIVLELNDDAGLVYGKIRAELLQTGQDIGISDSLIAAHAIANNIILVTNNIKHFQRIPNLKLQNWIS